jgi:hypothetical protein
MRALRRRGPASPYFILFALIAGSAVATRRRLQPLITKTAEAMAAVAGAFVCSPSWRPPLKAGLALCFDIAAPRGGDIAKVGIVLSRES